MCIVTHWSMCAAWLNSYVLPDSFMSASSLIHAWRDVHFLCRVGGDTHNLTYSHVWLVVFICFSWFMCVSCATWCPLVLSCRWVIHTTFIRVSCWMWVCFVVYVRDVMSPCIVVSVGDTHNIYTCVVLNVCVFRGLCSWRDVHLYCRVGGWYTQTHSHVCSVECMCVSWCMFVTWLICLSWFIYVCFLVCVCFIWLICLSCCMCVSCVFPDLTHSS